MGENGLLRAGFGAAVRVLIAGLVGGLGAGCSPVKKETASLVVAVDRFHQASNSEKPAAADFLATVACTDHDVCAAKEACVKASGATAKALRLMAEAQQGLDDIKANRLSAEDGRAKGLAAKLDEATQLLSVGHDSMPECDLLVTRLRLAHAD